MSLPSRDPEQERAERILRELKLEPRPPETRSWRWLLWLLLLALVVALALALLSNLEGLRLAWTRLARPEAIPGTGL